MLQTLRNAWKIPELRKKIIFTLLMVVIYRLGSTIPVPFINTDILNAMFDQSMNTTVLGLYNAMSGGAFSAATLFALSIQPYINASIIIQLLTVAIPALERLAKDGGEEGKKKIQRITRYATIILALLMGVAYYVLIKRNGLLLTDINVAWSAIVIILTFTAGSTLLMWLGEQITEFGIGNGISIILFASIVSRLPTGIYNLVRNLIAGILPWWMFVIIIVGAIVLIVFIIFITNAERRIPVQYAKRVVGRKMYGGQSTHLPMKVNMSGVLPVIFAQSIASIPATIAAFVPKWQDGWFIKLFDTEGVVYIIIYFLLILAFSYFYSTIQFNPVEVANNLKRNGGFIPGFRPGRPTSDFLRKVLNKITLFGALYLAIVAILPVIIGAVTSNMTSGLMSISIGGTSLIIVVGVALETVKGMEAQMLMRHYKGFLE